MSGRTIVISERLVKEARRGDEAALRGLVEAVYPLVRRWALVQTCDAADADDVTQDVLVRMVRKLDTFQGDSRFESWLYAATRNAALDRHRRDQRARRITDDRGIRLRLLPTAAPDPARAAEQRELGGVLGAFFEDLPERQRQAFDLVELQGYTASGAAEVMGLEAVSVRAHLFKARRSLRARILSERPDIAEEAG